MLIGVFPMTESKGRLKTLLVSRGGSGESPKWLPLSRARPMRNQMERRQFDGRAELQYPE
ncbi:hypothetical protein CBM2598_U10019 [Cupriavidus taiwanensis]|nr:hypothetical protein CBM2598_U10019 [Cupriavidus taiwanensis]